MFYIEYKSIFTLPLLYKKRFKFSDNIFGEVGKKVQQLDRDVYCLPVNGRCGDCQERDECEQYPTQRHTACDSRLLQHITSSKHVHNLSILRHQDVCMIRSWCLNITMEYIQILKNDYCLVAIISL